MLTIKHILFPVDFSKRCLSAGPLVGAMARKFGARVTLLSVTQSIVYGAGGIEGMPAYIDPQILRTSMIGRLEQVLVDDLQGVDVTRVVELGEAGQVIADFAHDKNVDLIMLPTHSYGPFRRLLLGSIAAKVLHDVQCPVWTEAHLNDPEIRQHLKIERVLCAVDRDETAAPLIEWAAEFAKQTGATLRLVHCLPGTDAFPERQFDLAFEKELQEQARTYLEKVAADAGVDAPLCLKSGDIARAVHEEAEAHGADVVIIGRGSIHETLGRLRTHAHAIIRHAHCPVISV